MTCENGVLVDTNIFIYLNIPGNAAKEHLVELKRRAIDTIRSQPPVSRLYYNLTIYKEVGVGIGSQEKLNRVFSKSNAHLIRETRDVMYLAASRYREYLSDFNILKSDPNKVVVKSKTIPNDCIIGATALFHNLTLITNNEKDFKAYFPELEVITLID